MQIMFVTRYSPAKGQRFEPGTIVDVDNEIALDMIQRGVAKAVRIEAEHAIAPGQTVGGS